MKTKMSWVKWTASDFLNGVIGLKADEIGVYSVIINLIYDKEGPIKLDRERIARRCGMRPTSFDKVLERLVDAEKLVVEEGYVTNARAQRVLETRAKVVEKWLNNLQASVPEVPEKSKQNKGIILPAATAGDQGKSTVDKESVDKKERKKDSRPVKKQDDGGYAEDFEVLWKQYPRTAGTSKKVAHDRWRMLNPENQERVRVAVPLFADMMRKEGRPQDKIKHFAVFLSERIYETISPLAAVGGNVINVEWHKTATREQWAKLLKIWRGDNNWRQSWGPAPGKKGCAVPADMLTPEDLGIFERLGGSVNTGLTADPGHA